MKKKLLLILCIVVCNLFNVSTAIAQTESKVAILTVAGSGKTQEEAMRNALRNAIEQAFGAFLSSNTQILNDELVKDEIVSVSSGNIQEYNVISEVQTPDGNWSNTVKAKVAIDKLTTFCKSKGLNVEFMGSLFALNIKQQILNEENELKAIKNMRLVLKKLINNSFDYKIITRQPTSFGNDWKIPVTIEATLNNNFSNVSKYLYNTLIGLSCTQSEIENYTSLKKKLSYIVYKPNGFKDKDAGLFILRNESSLEQISGIIYDLKKVLLNISINNGVEVLSFSNPDINFSPQDRGSYLILKSGSNDFEFKSIQRITFQSLNFIPILYNNDIKHPGEINFFEPRSKNTFGKIPTYINANMDNRDREYFFAFVKTNFKFLIKYQFLYEGYSNEDYIVISFDNLKVGISKGILNYDNIYSVDQIQKISDYKITSN
ncbi:MAG: hypothetical protein WCP85_09790 [Mariniphaga sp.]